MRQHERPAPAHHRRRARLELDPERLGDAAESIEGQKLYLLRTNPTAENLARFVLEEVGPRVLKGTGVRLVKVVVEETENGSAEASLT